MALLVQKFGGTSLGSIERINSVAKRISASKQKGNDIVVVVSAMGNTTNELNKLANSISNNPPKREMDMLLATGEQVSISLLSIALNEIGIPAISMTGSQVGIITESSHGKARILEIRTERLEKLLNTIKNLHSYEIPEILFWQVASSKEYSNWLVESMDIKSSDII